MVLSFKERFPWGAPTYFREKILLGAGYKWFNNAAVKVSNGLILKDEYGQRLRPKIHTIRAGIRWTADDAIHMAYGVRSSRYCQFNRLVPGLQVCKSVQHIEIQRKRAPFIRIDGIPIVHQLEDLYFNDGFDSPNDFWRWFNEPFKGQIIHFTDFKYTK